MQRSEPLAVDLAGIARAAVKRALDVVLSGLALVLLGPFLMLVALAVRLDSDGPVLFRQQRIGRGGTRFTCLKFRTMVPDADPGVHQRAFARVVAGQSVSDDSRSPFKLVNDPRVTRVGALLRRTSLDEMPQLWNVLRGEMSLVGPRPAIPYELQHYQPWQHQRHRVKPGITGLWQVYGRGTMAFDEMMALDVRYAREWTVWLDVKLLALTIPATIMQRGAR
ncbi:MAG TPA: sugar transferase [Thermomicrobiaceae bacterium]|nr:sugar transferase [Thermomicrobiaceae bacterium]